MSQHCIMDPWNIKTIPKNYNFNTWNFQHLIRHLNISFKRIFCLNYLWFFLKIFLWKIKNNKISTKFFYFYLFEKSEFFIESNLLKSIFCKYLSLAQHFLLNSLTKNFLISKSLAILFILFRFNKLKLNKLHKLNKLNTS